MGLQGGYPFAYGKFGQLRNGMDTDLFHDVSPVGIDGF